MLGVPINESSYVFCDNMSVVCNTTAPESTLKKKSNGVDLVESKMSLEAFSSINSSS